MKQTRLALALFVTSLAATPAFAAAVTMLQFGSFETRGEAEKKLSDISSKYKDTLGALPTNIREVKLPPDNLTVYRTQAGPVVDRSTAQGMCSKLASTGDECYIVQTAMVSGATPAVAATTPTTAAPLLASTSSSSYLSGNAPASAAQSVDMRDPLNRASLSRVNTSTAGEVPTFATAQASTDMQSALDKAAVEQNTVNSDIDANTATVKQEMHQSFWSRLNPFSSSEPTPVAPVTPKLPETAVDSVSELPLAAPAEPVLASAAVAPPQRFVPAEQPVDAAGSMRRAPALQSGAMKATPTQPPVMEATPIKPVPVPPAVVQATPMKTIPVEPAAVIAAPAQPTVIAAVAPVPSSEPGFDTVPVISQPPAMQLPPPPAPLKAQDRENLAMAKTPLPAPETTAAPISVVPLPPTGTGSVHVEEARRVPVTTTPTMPASEVVPVMAKSSQPAVSLKPSASEGIKTLWAQIGPFSSNDDALAYWANYRQNHPDFPVVRVRVTSSYQQLMHGANNYSLRVGPMAQRAVVKNLCASLSEVPEGQPIPPAMQCGLVTDLGVSSPLTPTPGMLPPSRYGAHR